MVGHWLRTYLKRYTPAVAKLSVFAGAITAEGAAAVGAAEDAAAARQLLQSLLTLAVLQNVPGASLASPAKRFKLMGKCMQSRRFLASCNKRQSV